jgi:hypothetical protein
VVSDNTVLYKNGTVHDNSYIFSISSLIGKLYRSNFWSQARIDKLFDRLGVAKEDVKGSTNCHAYSIPQLNNITDKHILTYIVKCYHNNKTELLEMGFTEEEFEYLIKNSEAIHKIYIMNGRYIISIC